jgi:hypothetical protein
MPGDPKKCREHALQCAEMAQRARNPEHETTLTNLAQTWISLAVELERSHALLDAYPEPSPGRPGQALPAKPHWAA